MNKIINFILRRRGQLLAASFVFVVLITGVLSYALNGSQTETHTVKDEVRNAVPSKMDIGEKFRINITGDDNVFDHSFNESAFAINGSWAFCADPFTDMEYTERTPIDFSTYVDPRAGRALSHDEMAYIAVGADAIMARSDLTQLQKYYMVQLWVWRTMSSQLGWGISNTHINPTSMDTALQGEILNAAAATASSMNLSKLTVHATMWVGQGQPLLTMSVEYTGDVKLKKSSSYATFTNNNSCYSLAGAEYKVYSDSACTNLEGTLKTDAKGNTNTLSLTAGTYYILETKASTGYYKDPAYVKKSEGGTGPKKVTINSGETTEVTSKEPPGNDPVSLILKKGDKDTGKSIPQGDASLEAAEYTVRFYGDLDSGDHKNKTPLRTWVFKTDKDGFIYYRDDYRVRGDNLYRDWDGKLTLPLGTITFEETKAPEGYNINPEIIVGKIDGSQGTFKAINFPTDETRMSKEPVKRGGIYIEKWDKEWDEKSKTQGDATLKGAEFTITNISEHSVVVEGKEYQPGAVVKVIISDEAGFASTSKDCLPYGTYKIIETKAPTGYLMEEYAKERVFTIRDEDDGKIKNLTLDEDLGVFKNEPIRGGVQITKYDLETKLSESIAGINHTKSEPMGATLEGIEFSIWNISKLNPTYGNTIFTPFSEDASTLREGIVNTRENGSSDETWKSLLNNPNSGFVTTISMHWNDELKCYTAETGNRDLVYGTYLIMENKTNDGYILSDKSVWTFEIREDGKIVTDWIKRNGGIKDAITSESGDTITELVNDEPVTFTRDKSLSAYNRIRRNDIEFEKIADTTSKRLQVAFLITNLTTGEAHVLVTNENGEAATHIDIGDYENTEDIREVKFPPHSWDTNANDLLLEEYDEDNPIPTEKLNTKAGIWFGMTEGKAGDLSDGTMAPVNDNLGALPYGKYSLKELRCEANEGFILQEFTFEVNANKGAATEMGADLGTVTDDREPEPEIGTTARDQETGTTEGTVSEKAVIIDKVSFKNLKPGKEYILTGTLMDKETGEPLKDAEGNIVSKSIKFTPETKDGFVEIPFEIDSTALAGKSVVVFEKLLIGEKEIAAHEDIEDGGQTITYPEPEKPEIGTTARDGETGTNEGTLSEKATIIDKVTFKNLKPGKEYVLTGTLMDKASGESLKDADGNPITKSIKFTPETKDGFVEIPFELDSSNLKGKRIVVFEKLFDGNTEIAAHEDIEDEGQTITYPEPEKPEIKTSARDGVTGTKEGTISKKATIIDKVTFKNLTPGKEYILTGTLMDKESKSPLKDSDGNVITKSIKFTPDEKDGFVEITFELDSSLLHGKRIVVFEKLFEDEKEIAVHEDIDDEDQTITYPEPEEPEEPETPDTPKTPGTPTRSPKTGDTTPSPIPFAVSGILSSIGLILTRKKIIFS